MGKLARTITKAEALAVASPGPRSIVPVLAPSGRLKLQSAEGAAELPPEQAARLYREFARGSGHGLLSLGLDDVGSPLPPSLAYWRQLATHYMAAVCALPDIADSMVKPAVPHLPDTEFETIAAAVPPMFGAEYVSGAVLALLWQDIDSALDDELGHSGLPFGAFLKAAARLGTSSAACISIWPRTARTRRRRSPSWPPIPRSCRRGEGAAPAARARPCRNTPAPATATGCCRC